MSSYIKRKSAKQEKRTAKEFGGRTTPASGAMWSAKGDVRTLDYLIENKYTDSKKYKLELKILEKIENEALKDNFRTPILQVDIADELSLVVLNHNDFLVISEGYTCSDYNLPTGAKSVTLDLDDIYLMNDEWNDYGLFNIQVEFPNKKSYDIIFKEDFLHMTKEV